MDKKIKILHLEDLPSDALLVKNALTKSKLEYQGLTVDTKDKFIAALIEFSPDIILADHSLPSFNSIEALKIVKQHNLEIPFIIVTATMSDETAVDLIMKGADDYIIKDRLSRLPIAIVNVLEKFRLKREHRTFLDTLINSEKRYRALVKHSTDGVVILDVHGKPTYVSSSVKNVLGYDPEEIMDMDIFTLVHPDEISALAVMFEKILAHPGVTMQGHTGRMLHKSGSWRWIEATVTNALNDPDISGIIDNFRDVTDKKHAEEAIMQHVAELKNSGQRLQLSEYRLKEAQYMAKIGSWEMDLLTSELTWSEQTYHIFERSVLNFKPTYQAFLQLIHPDDRMAVDEAYRGSLTDPSIDCIEHSIIESDGRHKIIEERWSVFRNDKGQPVKLVGVCQDITRQKIAAETIVRSEANLNAIIENTDSFIYSLDRNLTYVTFNSALSRSIKENYGINLTAGYHIFDFIDKFEPEASREWKSRYEKALGGEIVKFEKEFETKNFYSCTRFSIYPIWENQNIIGLSCFVDDITKQKQADEEDRFKANLLNTIGQAVVATDMNGVINYWNKAAEDIYEFTAEEAIGKNIAELTPTMAPQQQEEKIVDALKRGQTWNGEFKVRRKDGTYFQALVVNSPVYNKHRQLSGIIGVSTDITEKKVLERLLDKATTMARIGSYEADPENNRVFWSPMTKLIHEVDNDFLPDIKTGLDFYKAGYSREMIIAALDQIAEKQTPFDLELQIVTAKGNDRWVRVIGEAELVDDRTIVYGSFQDIDEMKKIELEVLKAYEEKNIILESIGDAFFAVDKDWVVNYWNREATRLLSKTKSEILNNNLWDVFASSVGSESYNKYHQAIELNQIVHFEDYYPPLERWLEVSAYPSANGLSVFFKDITERKLADAKLNELNRNLQDYTNELVLANKGMEQFSYMVSHNLRAPVANIMGLGGLLSDDGYPSELKKEFLKGILDNVQRLDDVIVDLNLILKVKRQISEKNEIVNLQVLVNNIQLSIQSLIVEENVRIITDFSAAQEFETLKTYLHSIFYNLILNGIKYHRPGVSPVIEIRTELWDDKLTISFKDNGMGIDLVTKKDQLFGLYKRFHHHVEGKGMGLFMVKTQVEMLSGTISVTSQINDGTTFLIEFNV